MTSSPSPPSSLTGVTKMANRLASTPVRELASLIRDGSVSPVELTEQCLARLDEFGPAYNSLVTLTSERALETARCAESELAAGRDPGPLAGIPWGAKDLL
ncbi:MAG: amidase, partial [Dehalococcoidia bacterium]|nr:amidase [Dehalococcoidia bacterium]